MSKKLNYTLETYRKPEEFLMKRYLKNDKPNVFDRVVSIKKYRVTVEEVDEPIEVLQARLQALWDTNSNWHYHQALESAAKELDYKFTGAMGGVNEKI